MTFTKDVFWGAAVTCFAVSVYKFLNNIGNRVINIIAIICFAMAVCLLRSNGWFVFLLSTFLLGILYLKKQKKLIVLLIVILISGFILKHQVLNALEVSQPDTIEALSIPAQQLARVITDGAELNEKQLSILNKVIDVDRIAENYQPQLSDPIKNLVRERNNQEYITEHKSDFVILYLEIGLEYPHKYIEAWVDQTKGYWNSGYPYWRWATWIQENNLGIKNTIYNRNVQIVIDEYLSVWENTSLLQIFISIGFYVWIILLCLYNSIIKGNKGEILVAGIFLCVIISLLMATPVYAEFRYAYAIFCGEPFIIVSSLFGKKHHSENIN